MAPLSSVTSESQSHITSCSRRGVASKSSEVSCTSMCDPSFQTSFQCGHSPEAGCSVGLRACGKVSRMCTASERSIAEASCSKYGIAMVAMKSSSP